ncbi:hypothetical protein Tco_0938988 [Tanacetum coccineum]|uniref:Uncharacterized protein n=1 Tax=Tanacetum coccineum TaxID=301880 RepID=A0ABQ5DKJ4_9ASTR
MENQALLSPEFVPKHVYPEFKPPKDEVFPAKEQPLPVAVSPTADSPGYIADFDPEEDPEEDPTDYPVDGGDDDDGDDESSDNDEDDDDVEEDEDEKEEHPTSADSIPPPVHGVNARMSIRDEPPIPFWSKAEISRLLAIPSPPPSPLSPWSSPIPQIPSPPLPVLATLPVSPPLSVSPPPLPASPTYPLRFRAAMIRQRAESPSTSHSLQLPPPIILSHTRASMAMIGVVAPSTHTLASQSETSPSGTPPLLPIPLPTPLPPLLLPSTDHRADRPEVCLPPQKRLCIALGPRYRSERAHLLLLLDQLEDEILVDMPGAPATDETELSRRMTNLVTTVRQDTDEIYRRLDEAQEAKVTEIAALPATDHARQAQLVETLRLVSTMQTQKMSPKRTTRANPADTTATTYMTNAQLKAMIDQGVTDALAARDADRSTNGDDSHNSRMGVRRT